MLKCMIHQSEAVRFLTLAHLVSVVVLWKLVICKLNNEQTQQVSLPCVTELSLGEALHPVP